MTPGRLGSRPS